MTDTNDEHDQIRAAIGTLLDTAPDVPVNYQPRPRLSTAGPSRWLLAVAAAAVGVLGVAGLVAVNARDRPDPVEPAATPAPATSTTAVEPPPSEPFDPDNGDVADIEEFRTQTEDFLDNTDFVADELGGDVSGATCEDPTSVAAGTTYRCVATVGGLGQYEFDVRIENADTFIVENSRPI